jgi:hypothetical protein
MLHETLAAVRDFLHCQLRLELKENAVLVAPVAQGISFLGFRVFPSLLKMQGRKWTRFRREVRKREAAFLKGAISEEELAQSVSSMIGHLLHADTLSARRQFFAASMSLG